MCGIFGYTGVDNNAFSVVLEGLKKLEYRGYDSWGIAVEKEGELEVEKHAGRIGDVQADQFSKSSFGFGHTRWATHGGVTDVNAHPHFACTGDIAVVHNGIIENWQELKKLLKKPHKIISETDTELAAHLVEEYYERYPLVKAVRMAFLKFKGLSAFLVADGKTKTLIAVKNGPPLVIGLSKGQNFVGSDANCLLAKTKSLIFLEDDQLAQITKENVNIFDVQSGKQLNPKIQRITWTQTSADKQHFPHFMLKEIYEQPRVLENILLNFNERIARFARLLARFSQVYLVGCGSAYYAGMAGSYILAKIAKKQVVPISGSEFIYQEPFLTKKNTLVVFLSQSGETIDVMEPLKIIKEKGIKTAALVNVFGSSLYRLADEKIWLEAGPEIAVVSTKAFTAKVGVLGLLACSLSGQEAEGKKGLKQTILEVEKILSPEYQKNLDRLAKILSVHEHIFVIGRGLSYPSSLEIALKIKEVSYLRAEGFSGGELKHGPIALIENNTPCLVVVPSDETYEAIISNAMEIKARGGYLAGISQKKEDIFNFHLPITDCGVFTVIPEVVLAQCLGYKLALLKGYDPDKPRNLAKCVTVK